MFAHQNRTTGVLFPRGGPDTSPFWQRIYCLSIRKPRAKCKRTQHCWPTSRNNSQRFSGCYMLRPFAHPFACCWELLHRLHTTTTRTQQHATTLLAQQCWELLFQLRLGVIRHGIFWCLFFVVRILGGFLGSLKDFVGF